MQPVATETGAGIGISCVSWIACISSMNSLSSRSHGSLLSVKHISTGWTGNKAPSKPIDQADSINWLFNHSRQLSKGRTSISIGVGQEMFNEFIRKENCLKATKASNQSGVRWQSDNDGKFFCDIDEGTGPSRSLSNTRSGVSELVWLHWNVL